MLCRIKDFLLDTNEGPVIAKTILVTLAMSIVMLILCYPE